MRCHIVSKVLISLDLTALSAQSGLSPKLLEVYAEAAGVVLDRFHGPMGSPTPASIEEGDRATRAQIHWERSTEQAQASHDNRIDASEFAACAVAIAAAHAYAGRRVLRRALHGSGADFLMRRHDATGDDFERLDVSGITTTEPPRTRLREKVDELRRGNDRRPGRALVVAFPGERVRALTEVVS
jgi:hypothetical protein